VVGLLPVFYFMADFAYYGPVMRLGPLVAWVATALAMVGLAAGRGIGRWPFPAGLLTAFVMGGTLLFAAMFLLSLPLVALAASLPIAAAAAALLCSTLFYGHASRAILRSRPRAGGWVVGNAVGLVLFAALPFVAQSLHDLAFTRRLDGLNSADPAVRAQTLRSLVGSRFCWSACVRAVCEARSDLDGDVVKRVLAVSDVDLTCDVPGINEWPG
jgi:hypothetical protein